MYPAPPSIRGFGSASSPGQGSVPPHTNFEEQAAQQEESDASSPEEDGRRVQRLNWNDEENMRLASSWLANSNDCINGNAKRSDFYWASVAEEFNKNRPTNGIIRTHKQCKSHWTTVNKLVTAFHGVYERAKSTYSSGQCDKMLMSKTREWYKKENKDKAFTMEYLWELVKDRPKWRRVYLNRGKGDDSKRTKISEAGAYTSSSNQEEECAEPSREKRPEGQRAAKARRKGKDKDLVSEPCENMRLYHEAVSKKADAQVAVAEASKEKTRMRKMERYLDLMEKDTSDFDDAKLKRHNQVVEFLQQELFS
jgi:hypothetical protein